MPKLTEYLLKLATDAQELHKYRSVREEYEKGESVLNYFTTEPHPGLTAEQAKIILSHDSRKVVEAVNHELATESSRPDNPFYGIGITIMCEVNGNIQHLFTT